MPTDRAVGMILAVVFPKYPCMTPPRDPDATRQHILEVAAEEMVAQGYKGTSLAGIIDKAGVSKGGLYHHFANKQELGYAVFEEVFIREFLADWEVPLSEENPVQGLYHWMREFAASLTEEELEHGCPMSRISMEMADVDEGFQKRALTMFRVLGERFAEALSQAKSKAYVKDDVDPRATSIFIVAAIQGLMLQGKCMRDLNNFRSGVTCLANYILSLQE